MHMHVILTLNRLCLFTHVDPGRVNYRGRAARVFQEIGAQGGRCYLRIRLCSNLIGSEGHTI